MRNSIVITGMARTPLGSFQGCLAELSAIELGIYALRAAVDRSHIPASFIHQATMGTVLSAGLGQAPARQVALGAGLSLATDCTTVNKMCGSAMKAVMLGMDAISLNEQTIVAAGGMESMSNAPYLLAKARGGLRIGHGEITDHMFLDGLEDAYDKGQLMGAFAEDCAKEYSLTREAQDSFAIESLQRANNAIKDQAFAKEIIPVTVCHKGVADEISTDEQPLKANYEKIPKLRPAFNKNGTITAANASSISDGAAAMILMSQNTATELELTPLATLIAHSTHSQAPDTFTSAPIGAIEKLLAQLEWTIADVDLFEINEAFAVVTMAAMQALDIPHEKVNVNGGACALGHPIGASGARIIITLISALKARGLKKGIACLCIGGGEATAVAIELP